MNKLLYMPVFRVRQEEVAVLKLEDFGQSIFPCLEIFKEKPRSTSRQNFEQYYNALISQIKSEKVFVDLPVHLKKSTKREKEIVDFITGVILNRRNRTQFIKKLKPNSDKIIPVISTYYDVDGEIGSITKQEKDLRQDFKTLAFRTFEKSLKNDLKQIASCAQKGDYVIMDLGEQIIDFENEEIIDIVEQLNKFNICTVIILNSAIPSNLANKALEHDKVIGNASNSLLKNYQKFNGDSFGDYVGIKKDLITKGGGISPGFIYYNAVQNNFYGYKGREMKLDEFEDTIVPDVIKSEISHKMSTSSRKYLSVENLGWAMIQRISSRIESGKSMAKFKRISMLHYMACIKKKIAFGDIKI